MEFETKDIVADFKIVEYKYLELKHGVLAGDSHFIEFTHTTNPLKVLINHTLNVSQGLNPSCFIKAKAVIIVKKKTTALLQDEKLFLIKSVIKTTISELEQRLLIDSGMNLGLQILSDDEILKSLVNNIGDLN